jgi:hypothetical protein
VCVPTVGALEWDRVAAAGGGFVISSFDAALVSTSVGIASVGGGAYGAGGGGFFAELDGVSELATVAALSDKRG